MPKLLLVFGLFLLISCGDNHKAPAQSGADSKAIIGEIDWLPAVNYLNGSTAPELRRNISATGLISLPSMNSRCTAFLIAEDILMTNAHCIANQAQANNVRFYPYAYDGTPWQNTQSYACGRFITANTQLDMALIQCDEPIGRELGIVDIDTTATKQLTDNVYVVHMNCDYWTNRRCQPQKLISPGGITGAPNGVGDSLALQMDLFYTSDTLGGSSGSPVFSAATNKVVALHHKGFGKRPNSFGRGIINSGVPMSTLVSYINTYVPWVFSNRDMSAAPMLASPSLPQISVPGQLQGSISPELGEAIVQLHVPRPSSFVLYLGMEEGRDLDIQVYDQQTDRLIARSEDSGDQIEKMTLHLETGVYHVRIYGYQNVANAQYILLAE